MDETKPADPLCPICDQDMTSAGVIPFPTAENFEYPLEIFECEWCRIVTGIRKEVN